MDRRNRLELLTGDITKLDVDAIVNAASLSLLGGGGVDGAIHCAAGPRLVEFCRTLHGCKPGEAKLSPGFDLKARNIIHTVGPVWRGGHDGEATILASCYEQSLSLAELQGFESIAFPAISTGAYGYPVAQATQIALDTVKAWSEAHERPARIVLVSFGEEAEQAYRLALAAHGPRR